jgi:hypothetical protein
MVSANSAWIFFSLLMTVCNAIIPTFTPILNQYAFGSGIIGSYFLGTALVTLVGILILTIMNQSSFSLVFPSIPLLIAGILYGAGTLSLQKSVERAPSPTLATLLPRNRALVNALLAFVVFGVTGIVGQWDVYITQAILVLITLITYKSFNTSSGEEHTWHVYSYMSMILLAISDVIVKNAIGYENLLTNITWFSLASAIVPMISLYRKTGSFVFSYRHTNVDQYESVIPLLLGMMGVFAMKIISQYTAIGIAENSANVRAIGSLAVPLTALLTNYFRKIEYTSKDIILFIAFSVVGLMSGIRSLL